FLALRQFPRLAGRGVQPACDACVCKTGRRRAIDFSPLCAFKSERVATWQSTRRQVANDCHFTCCFHRVLCQPPLKFGKVAKNSATVMRTGTTGGTTETFLIVSAMSRRRGHPHETSCGNR